MTAVPPRDAAPAPTRAAVRRGLAKAAGSTTAVVVLYAVLPLDLLDKLPVGVGLTVAMGALLAVAAGQVQAVMRAPHPAVRAIEALAVTVPVFLILYAASYYLLARDDPGSFSLEPLTRTDALYFTVTVFASVGFGDVVAVSQHARLLVTAQMILDLLLLGVGIRVFVAAVERGRSRDRR